MPKIDDVPENLKPYLTHGVELVWKGDSGQAKGDCPFCGKEAKFEVQIETTKFQCWSCREKGEVKGFVRKLWEMSYEQTESYDELVEERGFLSMEALMMWGFAKSITTGEWLLPGYNHEGKIVQLYRYVDFGGKKRFLATPTLNHGFFKTTDELDPNKDTFYILEGAWDGPMFWETAKHSRIVNGSLQYTADVSKSILSKGEVIGLPGIQTFAPRWCPLFTGKNVVIIFDNDHPKENAKTKKIIAPAGLDGIRHVVGGLYSDTPPDQTLYVKWGEGEYDRDGTIEQYYDEDLPSGFDVRDALSPHEEIKDRVIELDGILQKVEAIEPQWTEATRKVEEEEALKPLPCDNYKTLINSWRKAMKWTPGLEHGLSTILAAVTSTKAVGSQLWIKMIGPPSCGKSTLCEAVSVNTKYVYAKSTMRGFHSGYKTDGAGKEDNSLITKIRGKTLVTKDGDTLLQAPNLGQILSEARDLYDGTSRTHYRNKMGRDYSGVRMTWILCGTSSLRSIDQSELGERFLDCVIMENIDDEEEDDILMRVANKADRTLSMESGEGGSSQYDPELAEAMQLTGGYINYLRDNAPGLLAKVQNPEDMRYKITRLAKFVAFMRARPSKKQEENAEREFAARLVEQHIRLAKSLAVVLNRDAVDAYVLAKVHRVALDTARGQTLQIARQLFKYQDSGMEIRTIATAVSRGDAATRTMLRFLKEIGVAEAFTKSKVPGVKGRVRWRLTPTMFKLYKDVMEIGGDNELGRVEKGEEVL